jgi:hypothetical protein
MRRRLLPFSAVCCAIALSACGSSSSPGPSGAGASGTGASSAVSPINRKVAVAVTTCMRKHGITSFPEPHVTPPHPTASVVLIARDHMYFAIQRDLQDAAGYEADAEACGLRTAQKGANATPLITSD